MITHLKTLNIETLRITAKNKNSSGDRARKKLKILKRDGFECVNCRTKEKLTIAHLHKPRRNRNRNACSFKVDDCVVLCERCHIYVDIHQDSKKELIKAKQEVTKQCLQEEKNLNAQAADTTSSKESAAT